MNDQPISKQELRLDGNLVVHSIFDTIQGEGPFAGVPATFVRLAGCNLQCPGCDTEYTVISRSYSPSQLLERVCEPPPHPRDGRLVVFTGGEPFRQNIGLAAKFLLSKGFRVQIETNGTLYVPGPWSDPHLTIVCSPKTPKLNEQLEPFISAYKYVVDSCGVAEDGLPVLGMQPHIIPSRVARPRVGYRGPIYIQPFDAHDMFANGLNRNAAVDTCMRHGYTLCLQLHKILGIE